MSTANVGELPDAHRWLVEAWAPRLAEVLEAMTAERPRVEFVGSGEEAAPPDPEGGLLWWEQPLNLCKGAVIWVGSSESTWSGIGNRALKAAGIEEGEPDDVRGTYQELLQQALSALAQAIGARVGKEVLCEGGKLISSAPPPPPLRVEISYPGEDSAPLLLAFSPPFGEALATDDDQRAGTETETGASRSAAAGDGAQPAATQAQASPSTTIDLLLDVELPVSVSFGRARLPLKDVLKLTSGSIVELNRSVSEPVEVIVNNCVVARGEVVVIEGNYGVRINQIISRQERLRTVN